MARNRQQKDHNNAQQKIRYRLKRAEILEQKRQHYEANKDVFYERWIFRAYGLTWQDYSRLLENQEFRCAVCYRPAHQNKDGRLAVDHDHITGVVRGLLCTHCNTGIGNFRDSAVRLSNAAHYLLDHQSGVG